MASNSGKALRTPSGAPTAYAREKYGYKDTGEFPIWDKKSAMSALKLRGHANSPDELAWIYRQAAKYVGANVIKEYKMRD